MANFSAQDVKNLREQTGCGMMDCKKALTESNGDFDKAVEFLREKGLAAAAKKASRVAAEGMVYALADNTKKVGVVLEVNAETDFVAKNDMFKEFVQGVASVIMEQNPADVDALLACNMGDKTVDAELKEKILVIGENIKIRRFSRYEGPCAAYIHLGGTHAVLLGFKTSLLSGGCTMVIMILPTIIRTTQEALRTVPQACREGALGLGAPKWYMIRTVVLPSCRAGILTGCILSVGRIVGESAALLFTAGVGTVIADNILEAFSKSGGTLSVALYMYVNERGEFEVGFAIAAVLMILVLLINGLAKLTANLGKKK